MYVEPVLFVFIEWNSRVIYGRESLYYIENVYRVVTKTYIR